MMRKDEPEEAEFEMFDAVPVSQRKSSSSDEAADKYDVENLSDLIGTLGNDSNITITIDKQAKNGKYELVETYPCSDVTTDVINMLRDELGSGTYRFRAKRKGDKHPLWSNNYSFTKRLRGRDDDHRGSQNTTPTIDLIPVLDQLRAQNEMMLKMFEQQQNRVRPENAEEQQLRKMMLYKQLFAEGGHKNNDMDIFLKLIPLVKDLVAPDSGSNTTDLIRDVVKGMTEIVRQPKQMLPPRQSQLPGAGPKPVIIPPTQTVPVDPLKKKEHDAMMNYFQFLTDRAVAGDDPKELAAMVVEKIDADNLVELLEQENLIDLIIAGDVRAHAHQAWFETLIKEIDALIFEDGDDDGTPATDPPKAA